jgi:TldD protein
MRMKEKLSKALSNIDALYSDLRYEENRRVEISFRGKNLEEISESCISGFHLRVFSEGGFASKSFVDVKDLDGAIKSTKNASYLLASHSDKKLSLKKSHPVIDKIKLTPREDCRKMSIKEKKDVLSYYNDYILKNKNVFSTKTLYREILTTKVFVNSEGTAIENELININLAGSVIVKDKNNTQYSSFCFGGSDDFSKLYGRKNIIENKIKIASDLLNAKPMSSGNYKVLLHPELTGVFIHEAFGHFSEADIIEDNLYLRDKFKLGSDIGSPILNVVDDATLKGTPGHYFYDDEGVKGKKTTIIKNGALTGRLHSKLTSESFNEELSGNMKAVQYNYTPIIRMSNIFIEPGKDDFDELLEKIDNGYYLINERGGQTMGDQFSFGAEYGYEVKKGKICNMVRDINISGNLFKTLKNISAIGNDIVISEKGGCEKGRQMNEKSGCGGPHIIIENVSCGGK